MKKKIFVFVNTGYTSGDVSGYALCEDGYVLTSHFSSNEPWFKHDMGITGDWKHDNYKKHCPEGYELIWIEDPQREFENKESELSKAFELNQKLAETES